MHYCQVESYNETIYLQNCSNNSISIKTTRCRGQCYSEDFLIYDWKYTPLHYRHKHHLHCCSPNRIKSFETQIICENKRLQTVKYRSAVRCECKLCSDRCSE
ncbi:unnamed protein product [Adineta steineri]|uniref:CTCK domain-containing protein n=1 Tax=Adineta steineri TaxID=433720 RepID=A0A813PNP2_9BILA|nr:unnamed protein product [Adineta steineri]CAF0757822.1 unnamed protein product [Adineta steineri]CAF0865331.1 unnamed protein product [Adineta steineri]CAF0938304.1 unnamed protein product [Adineta steineri]CAF3675979.1 unnamed protein product [Adineta steineri]